MSINEPGVQNNVNIFTHESEELAKHQEWERFLPYYESLKEQLKTATVEQESGIAVLEFSKLGLTNPVLGTNFEAAFFRCIDERASKGKYVGVSDIDILSLGTPGITVLMNPQQRTRYRDYSAEIIKAHGISTVDVLPHEGCAAAAAALPGGVEPKPETVKKKAIDTGSEFAQSLNSTLEGVDVNKEFVNSLFGPNEFHFAFGVVAQVFDMTDIDNESTKSRMSNDSFDAETKVPQFNIGALIGNEEDIDLAASAGALSVKIANGAHGFGKDRFDDSHPFLFNIVAKGFKEVEIAKSLAVLTNSKIENAGVIQFNIIDISR